MPLKTCPTSVENLQTYHKDRFGLCFHIYALIAKASFVGSVHTNLNESYVHKVKTRRIGSDLLVKIGRRIKRGMA